MHSAMEAKNNIQYKPLDLVAISDFFANIKAYCRIMKRETAAHSVVYTLTSLFLSAKPNLNVNPFFPALFYQARTVAAY